MGMQALARELSPAELRFADWLAEQRNSDAARNGQRGRYGQAGYGADALAKHRTGARGEVGAAVILDAFPPLVGLEEARATGGYDMSHRVCVRGTDHYNGGLILHPPEPRDGMKGDPPDGRYVLTTVQGGYVTAVGWDVGSAVQRREFWGEPQRDRPCFLKPQHLLRPMEDLLALLAFDRYCDVWRFATQGLLT